MKPSNFVECGTIPRALHLAAKHFQESPSIVENPKEAAGAGRSFSFQELSEAVNQAGRSFVAIGIKPQDRVSIWAPNMGEWIVAALGLQSAGAVLVPVNTRFKGGEAGFVLNKSRAKMLFCTTDFLETNYLELLREAFGPGDSKLPVSRLNHLERVVLMDKKTGTGEPRVIAWDEFMQLGEEDRKKNQKELQKRLDNGSGDDISDILFTSGTTGMPKGVMVTHHQSLKGFSTWSEMVGLKPGDRYLIVNPFFHAFGYKSGWLASIISGVTIYPHAVFDVPQVMQKISEEKISVLPGPPTLYQSILTHPDFGKFDTSSLRVAVTGAAAIPVELIVEMRERLSFENILTGYGLTESSGIATMCRVGDAPEIIAATSGRAIEGVEVKVVDEEGQEMPRGESGEIWIKGYNITQGYLDDTEATNEAINAEGWLRTGDIGVMDDQGYVRITDRKKDMFIMGGFNAYPAEIENLMLGHKAVGQAAVVGVRDEKFGEVGMAFVIKRPGWESLSSQELIEWCKQNMANYKVPRQIVFVEELPLNASGKVLKHELRARLSDNSK